jgi:hypothetical protein
LRCATLESLVLDVSEFLLTLDILQITVDDFYVEMAKNSPFSTVEEMWADLDGSDAENIDAGIAAMRAQIIPFLT